LGVAEVRLRLSGIGGQGIVFAGRLLSQALLEEGKHVALRYAYGAEVMGTPVHSEILFSSEPILCPYFRKADVAVILHPRALAEALPGLSEKGLLVVDEAIELVEVPPGVRVEVRPFVTASARGRPGDPGRLAPLAALGFLARLGFFSLPPLLRQAGTGRAAEENIAALRLGFDL
jgi:2-oxoglutarate ferredoxin oxidoreductase subunit gamma